MLCEKKSMGRLNGLLFAGYLLLAGCMAGSRDASLPGEPLKLPAVYTRYLEFPVPSSGIAVEFNPPVLRWPLAKGDTVRYDVRLSADSLFQDQTTLRLSDSPWALFNPHQRLAPGEWYWQYRAAGDTWSGVQNFVVTAEARDLVSPPAGHFLSGIPNGHPRVLTDREGWRRLGALLHEPDARAIIREADVALKGKIPTEKDGLPVRVEADGEKNRKLRQDAGQRLGDFVYRTVVPLCQAWLLSGDDAYRHRATAIVMEVSRWDPDGVSGSNISDFADARCMLAMAIAYDTFYEALSMDEKKSLLRAIHARAMGFYRAWINNQEARLLSGHVWQHILHYFFQTALAVHGDDPDADAWLGYAYELFLARTPLLGGSDGGWTEGVSYFRMNMETLVEIPLFIKQYTGFDFVNAHPWYVKNIDWMIYHIPPGSSADGFGDNTEEVFAPGVEYVAYAQEMAKLTGSQLASWYAYACERDQSIDLSSISLLRWIRLTKTRLQIPIPLDDPALPMAKIFRAIGLVSMHTNPGQKKENLAVAMRSSPFGCYGHFLADHNAFNILYEGKRTFFRTGYKVTMRDPHRTGWYQHTRSNNSVLINGEGQPYSTEAFGWIPAFVQGREIAYAVGDASNAYASRETGEDHGVKKFLRHLVLLKPDILVIYDELESGRAADWTWLIHSMAKIEVDTAAGAFRSDFDNAKGIGRLWSSAPLAWAVADTFDVPAVNWRQSKTATGKLKTYDDEQWHLKATTASRTAAARFLAVLQISPGARPDELIARQQRGGVLVTLGDWIIEASLDTGKPAALTVRHASGTSALMSHGGVVRMNGKTYESSDGPVIVEVTPGGENWISSQAMMPPDLLQSWMHHSKTQATPTIP